ncbi:hypothetical protein MPTK1_3g19190 [Marchantia polymorpha subsp. ruderalis]
MRGGVADVPLRLNFTSFLFLLIAGRPDSGGVQKPYLCIGFTGLNSHEELSTIWVLESKDVIAIVPFPRGRSGAGIATRGD